MKLKSVLAACVLVGIPLVVPPASAADCQWDEPTHLYAPSGYGSVIVNEQSFLPGGPPVVVDTCRDPYTSEWGSYLVGDGDFETGMLGGRFPAYQPCLDVYYRGGGPVHPTFAHHGSYEGAVYTANQDAPWSALFISVFAGTDGEEIAGTCIGDGIIDDTNPVDCGSGPVGTGIGTASGVIAANPPLRDPVTGTIILEADCTKPAEGMAWVLLFSGPYFTRNEEPIVVVYYFTPLDQCTEEILAGDPVGFPNVPGCIDLAWTPTLPEVHPQNLPNTNVAISIPMSGTIEQTG